MVASSEVRVVKTVEQLPPSVRARFQERVRRIGEAESAGPHLIDMANPGKSWNAGCMGTTGLPSRELQFAGTAGTKCFVVFNTGGIATMQWVALFDLSDGKTRLIGVTSASPRCTDLTGLRKTVKSKAFQNAPKSMVSL